MSTSLKSRGMSCSSCRHTKLSLHQLIQVQIITESKTVKRYIMGLGQITEWTEICIISAIGIWAGWFEANSGLYLWNTLFELLKSLACNGTRGLKTGVKRMLHLSQALGVEVLPSCSSGPCLHWSCSALMIVLYGDFQTAFVKSWCGGFTLQDSWTLPQPRPPQKRRRRRKGKKTNKKGIIQLKGK